MVCLLYRSVAPTLNTNTSHQFRHHVLLEHAVLVFLEHAQFLQEGQSHEQQLLHLAVEQLHEEAGGAKGVRVVNATSKHS